jgi:hypothetical protein
MNKIIGFTISKNKIDHSDVDVFDVGLSNFEFSKNGCHIYLWGHVDLKAFEPENQFSLSFPQTNSLLDRNILVTFGNESIVVENDWLSSIPVFYNMKDLIVSTLPLKCLTDKVLDKEGLQNFMEFGYAVFEHTMFENVRFMRYFSKLEINENINVIYKQDPVDEILGSLENVDEEDVLKEIENYLFEIEKDTKGSIIVPTSGGYDSRLLNLLIKDKSRIRSYSYGGSKNQSISNEVVFAKKLAEILKTNWKQIELDNYYVYFGKWFKLFGFSTHLHGMYQIDFYKKILETNKPGEQAFLLSGIVGDAWAGKSYKFKIESYKDLYKLGLSHGLNVNLKHSKLNVDDSAKKEFLEKYGSQINNSTFQIISLIRLKVVLLSYLTQMPEYFGLISYTPFLNFNIVSKMLKISSSRREDRKWQTDFFAKNGIDINVLNLKYTKSNTLYLDVFKKSEFELLDVELLSEFISEKHLKKINKSIKHISILDKLKIFLTTTPKIKGICQIIGIESNTKQAIFEYFIIKAIEMSLKFK